MNAKAGLGVAITSAQVNAASLTTSITLKGGGSAAGAAKTTPAYFKFFSGYSYLTGGSQVYSGSPATEGSISFINPTGTSSDTSFTAG